jgi:hypothetical protein
MAKGCRGKRKRTYSEAIAAALRCSRKRGTPLRPYHCDRCGTWHLTKHPLRARSEVPA